LDRFFFATLSASAQTFHLGRWDGALEGTVGFSRQETQTTGQASSHFEDSQAQEQLTLRNTGAYVFDPRLVTLTLGGTFGLTQERLSSNGTSDTLNGTLWGYEASLDILPESPYSLNVYANRSQTLNNQVFGGRTESIQESEGASLYAREIYIPSTLSFLRQNLNNETTTGTVTGQQNQTVTAVTYQGNRGWENSEGSLNYGFVDLTDHVFPQLSYQSNGGNLYYSLDFGPELDRQWNSRIRFFTRTGTSQLTTATVDELLRIDHTDHLQTDYQYFLLWTETPGGSTVTNTGTFTLRHQLYESLTTTFGLQAMISTLPNGEENIYEGRLNFAYQKRLPWDGRLNVSLGGGLQYTDNHFQTLESFVPQETLTFATPFALPMLLKNPFVVVSSIVITKTAVGPLPAGCIAPPAPPTPLVLGRDYTVNPVGNLTEIVPIPCSGLVPGINPGDTIAVDYRFAVPTSLAYTTESWHATASVDYHWIRPYLIIEGFDQNLVSGQGSRFLSDLRSDTVGLELRADGQRVRATILGEVQSYTTPQVAYDAVRSAQFMGFTILPQLTLTLTGAESWFDYSRPQRHTQTYNGLLTMNYVLGANLSATAIIGIRYFQDTLAPTERTLQASLQGRWIFRKFEVDPSVGVFDIRRGNTTTKDFQAMLHIIRRF
jgi:hypothetical protein